MLSSGYSEAVEALSEQNLNVLSDERGRIPRYFYSQMNAEYLANSAINLRFLPVIFDGPRGSFVPPLFRNTILFHWPSMQTEMFRQVFNGPTVSRHDADNFSLAAQSMISF